jgi:hypothetical protein
VEDQTLIEREFLQDRPSLDQLSYTHLNSWSPLRYQIWRRDENGEWTWNHRNANLPDAKRTFPARQKRYPSAGLIDGKTGEWIIPPGSKV